MFFIQFQGTDKCFFQFRQEMKRATKKGYVPANWFAAGKTTDGLIHNCLENGCRQGLLACTFVDQWLDICLGKYTAARGNGVDAL